MENRNLYLPKKVLPILFILLLSVVGMTKVNAQTPYRQYADNGVLLNFHEIDNVDFRVFLLYNLRQDDQFVLIENEESGQFSIVSNDDIGNTDFAEAFETFYENSYFDFQMMSKTDIDDRMSIWKSQVVPQHFTSIMMDVTLRRSRSGDNEHCMDALAFCTSDFYEFESASTTQTADDLEPDPIYDGCIGSSYNPSWYYLRIGEPGPFIIHMEGHDPNNPNILRDIDFCLWGPYTEEQVNSGWACSHLNSDKIIDCNYSPSYLENAYLGYPENQHQHNVSHGTVNYHVPQTGEYYLLMITNYSRQPCFISFNKPEGEAGGAGTTDCSILPPIVNNDGPYCVGETIHLTAMGIAGASYNWTRPNGLYNPIQHTNHQNPTIQNCTMDMAGPYICTISKLGYTGNASDTTWVVIYPSPVANFTATTACVGTATLFDASSSTTNPPGYNIANYEWNFGDGTTGSGVTTSHTYAQAGAYTVTLNVRDADGHCSDVAIQTVIVVNPTAENYYVTICEGESYTFNGVNYTQEGEYTITIQTEGCESTATLHLSIIDLDVQIEAEQNASICEGDSIVLHAVVDSAYVYVSVGDIVCTDGSIVKPSHWPCHRTAKGIVFYVDNSDLHGYAVSLTQSGPMKWSTSTNDVQQLPNYSHWRDAITDFNGYNNTQILRTGTTAATYPVAWVVDFNNGWYLPSAGQLKLLYNELMDVNASLTLVGGVPIVDTTGTYGVNNGDVYLWSSTEWNANQAITVKLMDGMVKSVNKTTGDKYFVRAIINF